MHLSVSSLDWKRLIGAPRLKARKLGLGSGVDTDRLNGDRKVSRQPGIHHRVISGSA
jgi:hypothetical protein